METRPKC